MTNKPVTEDCLDCLCETMSGCNSSAICVNGACGIFRITWGYWVEAGELTLPKDTALSDDGRFWFSGYSTFYFVQSPPTAFTNCVNDPYCAANTVQKYMYKHGQDCNNDDVIDCLDFGALHKLGNLKCRDELPYIFQKVFQRCLKAKQRQAEESVTKLIEKTST